MFENFETLEEIKDPVPEINLTINGNVENLTITINHYANPEEDSE
jgi:hypothetical protein